ncbi:hypothetical protein [Bifidobacterium callitrichidarum]|uniref:hypothetical protein n=1 Tax=Bifidobacterium callitrichidarum TaxID=2052941 RepID=UPI0011B23F69|nr:hypothetical protein [Bifidobacterium callitrichidarum]
MYKMYAKTIKFMYMCSDEDAIDLALAEKRMREWDGTTISMEEMLAQLGITREELDKLPPVEIEMEDDENKR